MMPPAACKILADVLQATPGSQGLAVAQQTLPLPDTLTWQQLDFVQLRERPWQQRHDLAVAWVDAEQPVAGVRHALSALRDLHARRLIAFIPRRLTGWQDADALALGLQKLASFEHEGDTMDAWSYDILTYKQVPDWLNPRFWANPENWGKYRW